MVALHRFASLSGFNRDVTSWFIVDRVSGASGSSGGTTGGASSSTGSGSSTVKAASTGGTNAWIGTLSDSVIKADMSAAVVSGTVTEAGMAKLFTDLAAELTTGKTTLSASQLSDLKTIAADLNVGETASAYLTFITNALINGNAANAQFTGGAANAVALGNLAVGSTATQLTELNDKWFLGTDLPSSTVAMSGASTFTVTYKADTAALYGSAGPSMNDINQGYLGDCYLLSALAEVAHQNQAAIQSMITVNGNGTYGVRFYVNGTAEYVTVNNQLANGGAIFNSGTDIWASLVEKAYAQAQASGVITGNSINDGNSFSTIGNGGAPECTLEEITGAATITDFYANGASWYQEVYNNQLNGVSAEAGLSTAHVTDILAADLALGSDVVLSSWTNATDSAGKTTLVADHAMSVYGYDSATGNLEIRNPWGSDSWQYWDTTFEVSLSTLLGDGDTISVDSVTNVPSSVTTGALVSSAAALQANASVTGFLISDSAADVAPALTTLAGYSKLLLITLTDTTTPTLSLTATQLAADTAVLAKIDSSYNLSVTGAAVSGAAALQSNAQVTSFTVTDSFAHVSASLSSLAADSKLSAITLTDTTAASLTLTAAQYNADASVLSRISGPYSLTVTGASAATAASLQANTHVTGFTVSDTAANVTRSLTALNADTKLTALNITGTTGGDTLNLTGSKVPATINLGGDSAIVSVSAGLAAKAITFLGTPDAITLGTGAATISDTLSSSTGVETIANFQLGLDTLDLGLNGAASSLFTVSNTTVGGANAVALYSSANPKVGVVLTGTTLTAASLAGHESFGGGMVVVH